MRYADTRVTSSQLMDAENSSRNRHDRGSHFFSGMNVRWGIADEADRRSRTEPPLDLPGCVAENAGTVFRAVAELTERKEFPESGGSDFVPAHAFEVSRSHAEQVSRALEGTQQVFDSGTNFRPKVFFVSFHLAA